MEKHIFYIYIWKPVRLGHLFYIFYTYVEFSVKHVLHVCAAISLQSSTA